MVRGLLPQLGEGRVTRVHTFADYVSDPSPNPINWKFINVTDEAQRKKMQEGARNFFSHQVETSKYLN